MNKYSSLLHMHPANHWTCLHTFSWWSTFISFSRVRDSEKDSKGYHFPMFSRRRGAIKLILATLSDQRQARLMEKLYKKILGNKDCKLRNVTAPQNAKPNKSVITSERNASTIRFLRQRFRNSLIVFDACTYLKFHDVDFYHSLSIMHYEWVTTLRSSLMLIFGHHVVIQSAFFIFLFRFYSCKYDFT